MAITKREFAVKLLFWLLPWPISRALPRSLRIYYFGPGAGPPPGFYDYWGVPGFYWPDPEIPIDPDLFPDIPDDIFNPVDPVDPTPPDDWPDLPPGPVNPSDPFTPGPGPVIPHPPIPSGAWGVYLDDTHWNSAGETIWNVDHWDWIGVFSIEMAALGTWYLGFRPTKMIITHNYGPGLTLGLGIDSLSNYVWGGICVSGQVYDLDWDAVIAADITKLVHDSGAGGCNFDITNIEFFA